MLVGAFRVAVRLCAIPSERGPGPMKFWIARHGLEATRPDEY